MTITCSDAVLALKRRGLGTTAEGIAEMLDSNSRAVATALRGAVADGRVSVSFKKGIGYYKFKRLAAKAVSK